MNKITKALNNIPRKIEVEFDYFYAIGQVDVTSWDGFVGSLTMESYELPDPFTEEDIIAGINDGGFGVETIDRATVDIYARYATVDVHLGKFGFEGDQLKNAKKGILRRYNDE